MADRAELMRRYAPRLAGMSSTETAKAAPVRAENNTIYIPPAAGTGEHVSIPAMAPATSALFTASPIAWKPVVTTLGARTILTGPATTERSAMWDTPPNPNPHMVWMQGRYVGAETPNRNGALWSTADLQMGKPSVAHGPLNWLHEGRHVIGTIAEASFVPASSIDEGEKADWSTMLKNGAGADVPIADPHISALSAIWSWLYPDEASVVQMASENGVLAYSMECIAEAVECVGDAGCGQQYAYLEYSRGNMCDHLKERASVRRLVNPTFLGGAVIVPPTRPGWADANAAVMKQAASMAEKAFEDAGRPDIPANTWEQMMAGVVTFTEGTA